MNKLLRHFEQFSTPACVVDTEQHILFWNQAAANSLGFDAAEVIGKSCWQIFQGMSPQGERVCGPGCTCMQQLAANQPFDNFSMTVQARSGIQTSFNVSSIPILADNGEDLHLAHFLRPCVANLFDYNVFMLGALQVQRADGSIVCGPTWQQAEVPALFAYLVLNRGRRLRNETIIRHIWPGLPTPKAELMLAQTAEELVINLARGTTEEPSFVPITAGTNTYQWNDRISCCVDIDDFESLMQTAGVETDTERAIQQYERAVGLYRGDFLADLNNRLQWILPIRHHYKELCLFAWTELGGLYEQKGDMEAAKRQYLNALLLDPSSEKNYQKLYHLAQTTGDTARILRSCQRLAALLGSELDHLLEEEIQQLVGDQSPDESV